MTDYTAPGVARLMFADLPTIALKINDINERYGEAINDAAKTNENVKIKVDVNDLTLLLNAAMSACMVFHEQRKNETPEEEALRMITDLLGGMGEIDELEAQETADDRDKLPPELREFVEQVEGLGHEVKVTELN